MAAAARALDNGEQNENLGSVEAWMQILTKGEREIAVLCCSNGDNLRNELQIWEADGYRKVHPSPFYVRFLRRNSFKVGIYCDGAQVSSGDDYEIRQDCLQRGDHHAFCIDQKYIGRDLQFKLQNVDTQEILKTYPIRMSSSAGTSVTNPETRNEFRSMSAVMANLGHGTGNVTMTGNSKVIIHSPPSQERADP